MALYVRKTSEAEERQLQAWSSGRDPALKHRAEVVLLSGQGYGVQEISVLLHSHPANLRKWIHRFNRGGCDGLRTVRSGGPHVRISSQQRSAIVNLARSRPREMGLNFTRWTLHRLAQHAVKTGIVDRISHECVRQILMQAGYEGRGNKSLPQ